MFESITSHRRQNEFIELPFSIGHVCECMFYYNQVNLVCSRLELAEVIRKTNTSDLLPFLESGRLRIFLGRESYGSSPLGAGRFGYTIVHGKDTTIESEVYRAAQHVLRNSVKASRETDLLLPFVNDYRYESNLVDQLVTYQDFAKNVLRTVVDVYLPGYPIPYDLNFELHKADKVRNDGRELLMENVYQLDTNFDFAEFERNLASQGKNYSLGFLPQLSMNMVGAILDLGMSEQFSSELSLESTSSRILQAGLTSMQLEERDGQREIISFQEHILAPYSSISEIINSGKRSFSDFVVLDKNADKFRGWLQGHDFELGIVNEYIKQSDLKKFSETESGSMLKYSFSKAIAAGLALSSPAAALATTTAAALTVVGGYGVKKVVESVINKLNGWRPNQFINKDVKDFLK
jgi:hypothetical protein